mmetsp:Transcript_35067/g.54791  ORF Transcript_35067/g.54791 Transcript_35067/m.54791 type:complete len:399 (-) Transcript_35067:365-1561(-)
MPVEPWYALVVCKEWKEQREFKLIMVTTVVLSDFSCKARECPKAMTDRPEGLADSTNVYLPSKASGPKVTKLEPRTWVRINPIRHKHTVSDKEAQYIQIENEREMVNKAYSILSGDLPEEIPPIQSQQAGKASKRQKSGDSDPGAQDGKGGKRRYYKSLSNNYWNSVEEDGHGDGEETDITTPWRCEVCNIYFTSSQALGGHRINSTDHKQRLDKLKVGDTASLPGTPRLSLHVYSNEETTVKLKRTRLPPMAQMAGFDRVLVGYPQDVQMALARIQSPAAYFSSCSLEVFKRHEKFGKFGALVVANYFTTSSDAFEVKMQNPKTLPEVSEAGMNPEMGENENDELKIFARMLLTKKKFLDINRRAVSKRIKGIRKAGGERLKEFNYKKSKGSSKGDN